MLSMHPWGPMGQKPIPHLSSSRTGALSPASPCCLDERRWTHSCWGMGLGWGDKSSKPSHFSSGDRAALRPAPQPGCADKQLLGQWAPCSHLPTLQHGAARAARERQHEASSGTGLHRCWAEADVLQGQDTVPAVTRDSGCFKMPPTRGPKEDVSLGHRPVGGSA